uniref:Sacsin/Nov domain-containing protein n=1 Tax=Junco hyemalis TaxID=40217 RepID=A0A8C5IQ28_JUNHY
CIGKGGHGQTWIFGPGYLGCSLPSFSSEDVQEVVHEAVPSSTAIFLGTERLSTRVLGPEPFTACGPSEPITRRLRNILQEYGEEGDLFTEMVQNAEDASATVCRFLLDLRCCRKATSGLLDPGMAACHGPALWAYNNALFTEDDLQNITQIGAATKEGQAGRIGRFGLGFSSVYRVTDVPAVLSGETLLIFDPNGTHLGKHIPRAGSPGIRLDFSSRPRILRVFAEQFQPYHGIFGCCLPEPGPFPGSLFRLPFRTEEEAVTSQICSEAFGAERIQSLGTAFLGSNRLLLLFLKKVRELSLEMLPDTATSAEDTMPLVTLQRKEIRDLGAPGDPPSWAAIEQLSACEEESRTTWHYLVLVCQGDGELLELFHQNTQAGLHPPLPMAGVALPLAPTEDGKWVPRLDAEKGQVFCHLPMPIMSGLPIHLHGAFSILSNRKGLWGTAERGKWNQVLLHNAVPLAWLRALDHLRAMHEAEKLWYRSLELCQQHLDSHFLQFFPLMKSVLPMFQDMVREVYNSPEEDLGMLVDKNLSVPQPLVLLQVNLMSWAGTTAWAAGDKGDSAPLPCSGETPHAELSPALVSSIRRMWSESREPGWESWGCSAWRREGFRESLETFPMPKEALRELRGDLGQGPGMPGQG